MKRSLKRFSALLCCAIFTPVLFFLTPAQAAGEVRLVSTPHRLFDGTFRNDDLYLDLLPEGRLGKLVFSPPRGVHTWVIDPELVDEIADMSDGYVVANDVQPKGQESAKKFLTQLALITTSQPVIALPYGNPDPVLATQLAPSELRFYSSFGKLVLEAQLRRSVSVEPGWSKGKSFASNPQKAQYTKARKAISRLLTVVPESELLPLKARLAVLLSPKLNKNDRKFFYFQAQKEIEKVQSKLRIFSGKFQLTSKKSKMPITLVNEFNAPVTVNVQIIPMSYRVVVESVSKVTIEPKSRLQLSVPFTVLAPGPTSVIAQLTNDEGTLISSPSQLSIDSTIIDSRVAWFTTSAGVLLLLAGIAQSLRRVRKAKHENA